MQHQSYISYRIEPPLEFSEIVTHFYVARNEGSLPVTKTLIPTFQAILIFNFGSPGMLLFEEKTEAYQGQCIVLGPIKKPLSSAKFEMAFGFVPTSYEEGIRKTAEWYLKEDKI